MAMLKICQIALLLVAGFSAISSLAETSKRRDNAATVRVGILSDTHIGTDSRGTQLRRLERAYRLFKSHGVEAIINLGDIANDFRQDYYESYRKVSREIFPDGIDETFVYHGHDMFVRDPKKGRVKLKADKAFGRVAELLGDVHGQYRSFVLAGIPFLSYPLGVDPDRIEKEVTAAEKKYPNSPVFILHHVPCLDTSAGSQVARLADRKLREIMNRHPRAVVLSGHVHGSIAHEGKIWQDEFTAVGFGDFKNPVVSGAGFHVAVMELGCKRAVLRRYDIDSGREIRPEEPWTLDFPYDPARPRYRSDVRVKTTPEPAFSPGAKVSAEFSGDDGALTVRFPAAANPQWVESYTVSIAKRGEDIASSFAVKEVGAGVYAVAAEKRPREFKVVFDPACFADKGKFTVYVRPKGFWGNYGKAISVD